MFGVCVRQKATCTSFSFLFLSLSLLCFGCVWIIFAAYHSEIIKTNRWIREAQPVPLLVEKERHLSTVCFFSSFLLLLNFQSFSIWMIACFKLNSSIHSTQNYPFNMIKKKLSILIQPSLWAIQNFNNEKCPTPQLYREKENTDDYHQGTGII